MSESAKKVVAITGSIGSGKSTVSAMFGQLGASVISADAIAYAVSQKGGVVYQAIIDLFGRTIVDEFGEIDRRMLGRLIFEDTALKTKLEGVMLPAIRERSEQEFTDALLKGAPLVIYEAPIFFEAKLSPEDFLALVCVTASTEQCISRAASRLQISEDEVRQRFNTQMPLERKAALSDFVIDNSGGLEDTKRQVEEVYRILLGG